MMTVADIMAEGVRAEPVAATIPTITHLTLDEKLFALSYVMMGRAKLDLSHPPVVGDYLTRCNPDTTLFIVTEVEKQEPQHPSDREDYLVTLESAANPGSPRIFPLSELVAPNVDGAYFIKVMPGLFGASLR